jgi:large subunit ribosomal protein L29
MKIKEIRELSEQELATKRRDLKQELFHLRMQQQAGQLEKPSQVRSIRRDVARIESVLSQRRIAAAATPSSPKATV